MSLIRDALIKAEKDMRPSERANENLGNIVFKSTSGGGKRKHFVPIFLGGCFFFTVLILALVVINKPARGPKAPRKALRPEHILNALVPDFRVPLEEEKKREIAKLASMGTEIATSGYESYEKELETPKEEESTEDIVESAIGIAVQLFKKAEGIDESDTKEAKPAEHAKRKTAYVVSSEKESSTLIQEEEKRRKHIHLDPIDQFVNNMTITGVMFSDTESKVLMNNNVYSIDSIVSTDPKLRLVEITPHELIFVDEHGRRHAKEF